MTQQTHDDNEMAPHDVVSNEDWLGARKALLAKEKELTHMRDQLSQLRRDLPWEAVEKDYVFEGPNGTQSLSELFEGRSQLVVYHMMGVGINGETPCRLCSFWADSFSGVLPHMNDRDVTLVVISPGPMAELRGFAQRVGWAFPLLSSAKSDFDADYEVSYSPESIENGTTGHNYGTYDWPGPQASGVSVFAKDPDGKIFHTYSCYVRGLDALNVAFQYLDLVPKGRNEDPQGFSLAWVRYSDEYSSQQATG